MADKSIADDPSQWTTPLRENNIPTATVGERVEAARKLVFSGHTLEDYHILRRALYDIMDSTTSLSIRRSCKHALDETPMDGCII